MVTMNMTREQSAMLSALLLSAELSAREVRQDRATDEATRDYFYREEEAASELRRMVWAAREAA